MRCDTCDAYRLYAQPIVALRSRRAFGLVATLEREGTPQGGQPDPVGRYHVDCYELERGHDPRLPVARS